METVNLMMKPSQVPTRAQITEISEGMIAKALDGNIPILTIKRNLKMMKDILEKVEKGIAEEVEREAQKYGAKVFVHAGVEFRQEQRTTKDYSEVQWERYLKAKETVKECESVLKSLKSPMVDPDTGELIQPPIDKVTTYLQIKY